MVRHAWTLQYIFLNLQGLPHATFQFATKQILFVKMHKEIKKEYPLTIFAVIIS